jgi:hypothetical protein
MSFLTIAVLWRGVRWGTLREEREKRERKGEGKIRGGKGKKRKGKTQKGNKKREKAAKGNKSCQFFFFFVSPFRLDWLSRVNLPLLRTPLGEIAKPQGHTLFSRGPSR